MAARRVAGRCEYRLSLKRILAAGAEGSSLPYQVGGPRLTGMLQTGLTREASRTIGSRSFRRFRRRLAVMSGSNS